MVEIRPYSNDDYNSLKINLEEAGMFDKDCDSEEKLHRKISESPESILVAVCENEIVGSVYIIPDHWDSLIFRLVVKKSHREKGIGGLLLEEAENRLRANGYTSVSLLVNETELERLSSFYEKRGFEKMQSNYRYFFKELK